MSLTQLSLKGALVTASSVAVVQGCFAVIRSKAPVSAKVQALATLTSYVVYNVFLYATDHHEEPLRTNRYLAAIVLCAVGKAVGIVAGNEKLMKRKEYDFFAQYMITATAQIIMTLVINILIANTLSSGQ